MISRFLKNSKKNKLKQIKIAKNSKKHLKNNNSKTNSIMPLIKSKITTMMNNKKLFICTNKSEN